MSLKITNQNPWYKKSGNNMVFSLRIDENVYELIRKVSDAEGRSINSQLLRFIEDGLIDYLENQN